MEEKPKSGRVGLTISLSVSNFEYLNERCKFRGEKSRIINEAIHLYRESDSSQVVEKIRRLCIGYKLDLIPLINSPDMADVAFLLRKCRDHRIQHPLLGEIVPEIIKSEFHEYYSNESVHTVESEKQAEPVEGY